MYNTKECFDTNGYIILRNILPKQLFLELISITDKIQNDNEIIKKNKQLYNYEKVNNEANSNVIRRIQSPEIINSIFQKIAMCKELLDSISVLIGNDVRLERIKIHLKNAYVGSEIAWHQDWAYQVYTNDSIITVGIMLDDCTLENAPIHVIPGSHKGPVYPHISNEIFTGKIDMKSQNIPIDKSVPLLGNAGDITVHHYRILHYSPINLSNMNRRILLLRYAAADAWPLMGSLDYRQGFTLKSLQSRIVLGKQTLEPRLEKIPIRMPMPYPEEFYARE